LANCLGEHKKGCGLKIPHQNGVDKKGVSKGYT